VIISLTEQVLDAKGLECDSKISKISEEQLREILEGVRRLRKRKKKKIAGGSEDNWQKQALDVVAID
jgi:ABC-type phosphate transport system auxiliary subunit